MHINVLKTLKVLVIMFFGIFSHVIPTHTHGPKLVQFVSFDSKRTPVLVVNELTILSIIFRSFQL